MQAELKDQLEALTVYWTYLEMNIDASNPLHFKCGLNNLIRYKKNFREKFPDTWTSKVDIVKEHYDRQNYNNDMAFECLSLSTDFNFAQNPHAVKITELI